MKPLPVVAGLLVGLLVGGLVTGVIAWTVVKKEEARVRRGWYLVPVVVAAKSLAAGHVLSFDDVSMRSVPEQFVTSSVVKPDSASYVVGAPLTLGWSEGEPLVWSAVAAVSDPACGQRVEKAAQQLGPGVTPAAWEVIGAVRRRHLSAKGATP